MAYQTLQIPLFYMFPMFSMFSMLYRFYMFYRVLGYSGFLKFSKFSLFSMLSMRYLFSWFSRFSMFSSFSLFSWPVPGRGRSAKKSHHAGAISFAYPPPLNSCRCEGGRGRPKSLTLPVPRRARSGRKQRFNKSENTKTR